MKKRGNRQMGLKLPEKPTEKDIEGATSGTEDDLKLNEKQEEQFKCKPPIQSGLKIGFGERFQDLGLAQTLADHLHGRMGFTAPTHIQQEAIPVILSGKDVLINAETGTGKTLVYLAAIVDALQGNKKRINRTDGTYALVLVPTRELCAQVLLVAEQLVHRFIWLVPGALMGGENRSKEKARLRKGVTILIATPGRLLDHLKNTESFKLSRLRWLVFDEADRLLDLGFEKDIRSILTLLNSRQVASNSNIGANTIGLHQHNCGRQHVLLSATLNEHVNQLAELSLNNPVTVGRHIKETNAGDPGAKASDSVSKYEAEKPRKQEEGSSDCTEYNIPPQLNQRYYKVPSKLRLVALLALLRQRSLTNGSGKTVIFLSTCDAVDFHFSLFQEFGLPPGIENQTEGLFLQSKVFRLHGNMPQKERTEAFVQFGQAGADILVCTDVASRGLDFKGVTCIVQYDPPGDPIEYVHRVGRTARLGQAGEAILFLQPCEMEYLTVLENHGVLLEELPVGKLLDVLPTDRKRKQGFFSPTLDMHPSASYMHLALESFVSKEYRNALAAKAFGSYIRSYSAYKSELKPIFQVHKLHLGHVAKSFGLNSAPSVLGQMGKRAPKRKEQQMTERAKDAARLKKRRLQAATMLE